MNIPNLVTRVLGRTALSALVLAAATTCREQPSAVPVAEWPLAGGSTVRDIVSDRNGTVLLVFTPSELFRCQTILPEWLEQRREQPARVRILLSRAPRARERTSMATRRIGYDGVLPPEFTARNVQPPEVYVLRADTVVYHSPLERTRFTTPVTDSVLAYPGQDPAQVAVEVMRDDDAATESEANRPPTLDEG